MESSLKRIKELGEKLGAMQVCNILRSQVMMSDKQVYSVCDVYHLIDSVICEIEKEFYKEKVHERV